MAVRPLPALVLLLVFAAPAEAATVSVEVVRIEDKGGTHLERDVEVVAAPGEANRIAVVRGDRVVVRDDGAPLVAGDGCEGGGAEVTCAQPIRAISVDAGDGDDTIDVAQAYGIAYAGEGDDVVLAGYAFGGPGDDVVTGTTGSFDTLDGGPGADRLTGADGDDYLRGGEGPDVLDGGAGHDRALYDRRRAPLVVDLAAGEGGGDVLTGFEAVTGGRGPDLLRGTGGPDELDGGRGDDVLEGRGGDDVIDGLEGDDVIRGGPGDDFVNGWEGRDRLLGGAGDDRLSDDVARVISGGPGADVIDLEASGSRDRIRTTARCGAGADRVVLGTHPLLVARDCERVSIFDAAVLRRTGRRGWRARRTGRARVRVELTPPARGRVRVAVFAGGKRVAVFRAAV